MSQKNRRQGPVVEKSKIISNNGNDGGSKIINDNIKRVIQKTDTNEIPVLSFDDDDDDNDDSDELNESSTTKRTLQTKPQLEPVPVYQGPIPKPTRDTKDSLEGSSTLSFQEANKRVDDILSIAEKVSKSTSPENFDIVFRAVFKAYVMSTFRHHNNMSANIEI